MNANFDEIHYLYSTLNIAINQICPQSFFIKGLFMLIKTTVNTVNNYYFIALLTIVVETMPENNHTVVVLNYSH